MSTPRRWLPVGPLALLSCLLAAPLASAATAPHSTSPRVFDPTAYSVQRPAAGAYGTRVDPTSPALPEPARHDLARATRSAANVITVPEPGLAMLDPATSQGFIPEPQSGRVSVATSAPQGARLEVSQWGEAPVQSRRGGGPVPMASVVRTEDQSRAFPVALPVGCTRMNVVGTPAVRALSVDVRDPSGRVVHHDARRGRSEAFEACPMRAGVSTVRVRMQGPAQRALGAELFVSREPGVAENLPQPGIALPANAPR